MKNMSLTPADLAAIKGLISSELVSNYELKLEPRFTSIDTSISSLDYKVDTLHDYVSDRLDDLEDGMRTHTVQIGQLQTDMGAMQSSLSEMQSSMITMQSSQDAMQLLFEDIADTTSRIERVQIVESSRLDRHDRAIASLNRELGLL